jgi:hypothetical protein
VVRRLILIAVCMSTLAVAASGCGGGGSSSSSGASPNAWAANVCGAFSEWAVGMQADSHAIASGKRDLVSVKAKFVDFLEKSVQRTDTMLSKVKAGGSPSVKNGPALQRELEAVLERARDSFAKAVPRGKALPTTDQATFARKVGELSLDVQKELTATGQTFKQLGVKYKDKSLTRATSNEPACKKLSSR